MRENKEAEIVSWSKEFLIPRFLITKFLITRFLVSGFERMGTTTGRGISVEGVSFFRVFFA